jgi:hypothetical protein
MQVRGEDEEGVKASATPQDSAVLLYSNKRSVKNAIERERKKEQTHLSPSDNPRSPTPSP